MTREKHARCLALLNTTQGQVNTIETALHENTNLDALLDLFYTRGRTIDTCLTQIQQVAGIKFWTLHDANTYFLALEV